MTTTVQIICDLRPTFKSFIRTHQHIFKHTLGCQCIWSDLGRSSLLSEAILILTPFQHKIADGPTYQRSVNSLPIKLQRYHLDLCFNPIHSLLLNFQGPETRMQPLKWLLRHLPSKYEHV